VSQPDHLTRKLAILGANSFRSHHRLDLLRRWRRTRSQSEGSIGVTNRTLQLLLIDQSPAGRQLLVNRHHLPPRVECLSITSAADPAPSAPDAFSVVAVHEHARKERD